MNSYTWLDVVVLLVGVFSAGAGLGYWLGSKNFKEVVAVADRAMDRCAELTAEIKELRSKSQT